MKLEKSAIDVGGPKMSLASYRDQGYVGSLELWLAYTTLARSRVHGWIEAVRSSGDAAVVVQEYATNRAQQLSSRSWRCFQVNSTFLADARLR